MTKPKNQDTHLNRSSATKADVTHAASMQILETSRLVMASKMERLKTLRLEAERLNPPAAESPLAKRRSERKTT